MAFSRVASSSSSNIEAVGMARAPTAPAALLAICDGAVTGHVVVVVANVGAAELGSYPYVRDISAAGGGLVVATPILPPPALSTLSRSLEWLDRVDIVSPPTE